MIASHEEVCLRVYDTVSEARASIGCHFGFYNAKRPHSSRRTPDHAYFNASLSPAPLAASPRDFVSGAHSIAKLTAGGARMEVPVGQGWRDDTTAHYLLPVPAHAARGAGYNGNTLHRIVDVMTLVLQSGTERRRLSEVDACASLPEIAARLEKYLPPSRPPVTQPAAQRSGLRA